MVSLTTLISFWKKKEPASSPESERIIPLPPIPDVPIEAATPPSKEVATGAREALKVLKLERQILGAALTTIYESHSKGLISQAERDRLLEKYKVDLTSLEKSIEDNQRIVDLFDLESAREELITNFNAKLAELDEQVKFLKSGGSLKHPQKPVSKEEPRSNNPARNEERKTSTVQQPAAKPSESQEQEISDAEKRIEQIRAEILKAMDRLEQIESEG